MSDQFTVRCRSCRRTVLFKVPRIGDRESDALVSHLKMCRPDLVNPRGEFWRPELGPLLERFDVAAAT